MLPDHHVEIQFEVRMANQPRIDEEYGQYDLRDILEQASYYKDFNVTFHFHGFDTTNVVSENMVFQDDKLYISEKVLNVNGTEYILEDLQENIKF